MDPEYLKIFQSLNQLSPESNTPTNGLADANEATLSTGISADELQRELAALPWNTHASFFDDEPLNPENNNNTHTKNTDNNNNNAGWNFDIPFSGPGTVPRATSATEQSQSVADNDLLLAEFLKNAGAATANGSSDPQQFSSEFLNLPFSFDPSSILNGTGTSSPSYSQPPQAIPSSSNSDSNLNFIPPPPPTSAKSSRTSRNNSTAPPPPPARRGRPPKPVPGATNNDFPISHSQGRSRSTSTSTTGGGAGTPGGKRGGNHIPVNIPPGVDPALVPGTPAYNHFLATTSHSNPALLPRGRLPGSGKKKLAAAAAAIANSGGGPLSSKTMSSNNDTTPTMSSPDKQFASIGSGIGNGNPRGGGGGEGNNNNGMGGMVKEKNKEKQKDKDKAATIKDTELEQDKEDDDEMNTVAREEDKRRRNTAASARFRVRKKEREAALEASAKTLQTRVSDLEKEVEALRTENGWLRGLIVDKAALTTIGGGGEDGSSSSEGMGDLNSSGYSSPDYNQNQMGVGNSTVAPVLMTGIAEGEEEGPSRKRMRHDEDY